MAKALQWIGTGLMGLIALAIYGFLFGVLPFAWGRGCAVWHRARGTRHGDAYFRAAALPSLCLLGAYFLVRDVEHQRVFVFWGLVTGNAAAFAGVRWECRRHQEPPRLGRWWSEEEYPSYVFECWKCGKTKSGPWIYESTLQDRDKQEYAFAWMPVCEKCGLEAKAVPSGPWRT